MHRFHLHCVSLLIACCSLPAQAQVLTWKKGQRDIRESLPPELNQPRPWEVPVKLQLTPAAEPSPPLKYRCWIPLEQRQPGNVNASVSQAMIMYLQNPRRVELDKQYAEVVHALPDTTGGVVIPTAALRGDIRDYLQEQADVLKQLHFALRLDTIDSNYAARNIHGIDAFDASVVGAKNLRLLSNLLQLESSLAIAEGRFDDALHALQSGFRLAEVAQRGNNASVIGQLISLIFVSQMKNEVQEMLQQPAAPNMYWALASLPQQELASTTAAMQGELLAVTRKLIPWTIEDLAAESESQAEDRLVALVSQVRSYIDNSIEETAQIVAQDQLIAAVAVAAFADRALMESEDAGAGNCQALLIWTTSDFQATMQTVVKWFYLPLDLRLARKDLFDDSISRFRGFPSSPAIALAMIGLPAVEALDASAARSQRQHALLITLEALRAYAAENAGALPETLDNLRPLPAWPDSSSGKPFKYRRNDPHHAVIHIEKSGGIPSEYHIEMRQ